MLSLQLLKVMPKIEVIINNCLFSTRISTYLEMVKAKRIDFRQSANGLYQATVKIVLTAVKPVLLLGLGLSSLLPAYAGRVEADFYRVTAGNRIFIAQVAVTPAEKQLGLMYRSGLEPNTGLLMIFQREHRVPIWMKNMLIPIDVAWISSSGEVVDKMTLPLCHVNPCQTYSPRMPARYVLEVAAGSFPLNIGDRVEIMSASGDSLLPPESGIIAPQAKF